MDEEEYEVNEAAQDPPTRSVALILASVIWLVFGLLTLAGTALMAYSLYTAYADPNVVKKPFPAVVGITLMINFVIGAIFTAGSIQLLRGSPKEPLLLTILSFLLGLLFWAIGGFVFTLTANPPPELKDLSKVGVDILMLSIIYIAIGCVMMLASALSLIGRGKHQRWWVHAHPPKTKKPKEA